MSTNARRVAPATNVARFVPAATTKVGGPLPAPKLIPLAFTDAGAAPDAVADPRHDLEARELQLPSVSSERVREVETQAEARGYAKGLEAARADTLRERQQADARLEAALREIGSLEAGIMRRAERELIQLALAMAERILRREVDLDPDLLLVIARVAIDRLGERAAAVVHLSPADHARLTTGTGVVGLDLVADPAIPPGGCLVRSAAGDIDAGIEAQIREVARDLLGVDDQEDAADAVLARR